MGPVTSDDHDADPDSHYDVECPDGDNRHRASFGTRDEAEAFAAACTCGGGRHAVYVWTETARRKFVSAVR